MAWILAGVYYLVWLGALAWACAAHSAGTALLVAISLWAIFGVNVGAYLPDIRHEDARPKWRWKDSRAPEAWGPLLEARNLAAQWYRGVYMPRIPELVRIVCEWAFFVSGVLALLATMSIFQLKLYAIAIPQCVAPVLDVVTAATLGLLLVYVVWDYIGQRSDEALDFDPNIAMFQATMLLGVMPPDEMFAKKISPNEALGVSLWEACGGFAKPATPLVPVRIVRAVLAKFAWPIVSALLLAVSALAVTAWRAHAFSAATALQPLQPVAWVLAGAYAYFLALVPGVMSARWQACHPGAYSPYAFTPLRLLLDRAAYQRDHGYFPRPVVAESQDK